MSERIDNQQLSDIKRINITQAESKRVVALIAHLRQIFSTVLLPKGGVIRPVDMDHANLVLSSASFRALLFDDSPSPILLDFIRQHELTVEIETFETNLAMLLLAQVEPASEGHISDFFLKLILDPAVQKDYELGKSHPIVVATEACRAFESLSKRPEVWKLSQSEDSEINSGLGYSNLGGPMQMCTITRKVVPLQEWGNVRLGFLKNIPIRRRNIICYVANKLGGVHFDSKRPPRNETDKAEFKVLAQAYDWEMQAVMHAGLVAVALACVEVARIPLVQQLLTALERFQHERQKRLREGLPIYPRGDDSAVNR
jgi:hypothetical protein